MNFRIGESGSLKPGVSIGAVQPCAQRREPVPCELFPNGVNDFFLQQAYQHVGGSVRKFPPEAAQMLKLGSELLIKSAAAVVWGQFIPKSGQGAQPFTSFLMGIKSGVVIHAGIYGDVVCADTVNPFKRTPSQKRF